MISFGVFLLYFQNPGNCMSKKNEIVFETSKTTELLQIGQSDIESIEQVNSGFQYALKFHGFEEVV